MAAVSAVDSVVEAVGEIVPVLRENTREAEDRRWLPDADLALLDKAGVFRTGTPKRFGGLDFSLAEQARVLTQVARGCGSSGWVSMVYVSNAWCATLYPERAQEEVFAGSSARISGGFTPSGSLVPADGGYRLSGSWRFNTGCRGADWNLAAAVLEHPAGSHEEVVALVPMTEFSVADDWDPFAGAGTGSVTSTAVDVFVPAHRVITFEQAILNNVSGRNTSPGREYSLFPLVMAQCAAVCIGIARGAYELFLERVVNRPITYTGWSDQRQHPLTQIQVATAANKIAAAEGLAAGWWPMLQDRADAGEQPVLSEKGLMRGQTAYAIHLAREAVDLLFRASGASAIQRSVVIQSFYRDIQAFAQHALLLVETNLEVQGRVLLGLDPDTPFL